MIMVNIQLLHPQSAPSFELHHIFPQQKTILAMFQGFLKITVLSHWCSTYVSLKIIPICSRYLHTNECSQPIGSAFNFSLYQTNSLPSSTLQDYKETRRVRSLVTGHFQLPAKSYRVFCLLVHLFLAVVINKHKKRW